MTYVFADRRPSSRLHRLGVRVSAAIALAGVSLAGVSVSVASASGRSPAVAAAAAGQTPSGGVQTEAPWNLDRLDQRTQTYPREGNYSHQYTGAGVDVYVVDSGIRITQTEFTGRLKTGWYKDFGDGKGISDCNGHGTAIAGTVGGTHWGVAKAVSIVPVKVVPCDGAWTSSVVVEGINWVIGDHAAGQPAVAVLGMTGPADTALDNAVKSLIADGVTVVVPAGDLWAKSSCDQSPSRVPGAITAAGSELNFSTYDFSTLPIPMLDERWSVDKPFTDEPNGTDGSSFGACNDVFALAESIYSASHEWDDTYPAADKTGYGTAFAAAEVAGAAAMILQQHPAYTPAQVWSAMEADTVKDVMTGLATGDPNKFLHVTPYTALPAAPNGILTAVAPETGVGSGQVKLTWGPPTGSVTDYAIERSTDGTTWTTVADGVSTAITYTVSGLTNGTQYTFRVAAINAGGTGPWSPTKSATPVWYAGAPSGLAAAVAPATGVGSRQVKLTWSAPTSTGGAAVSDYVIESSTDGKTWTKVDDGTSSTASFTVSGLTNGTAYTFRVSAKNSVGVGSPSATVTATPLWKPDALVLTAKVAPADGVGSGEVRLSWPEPVNNGSPITDYHIEISYESPVWSTIYDGPLPAPTYTVRNLLNNHTWSFAVLAKNAVGWSDRVVIRATPVAEPTVAPGGLTASVAPAPGATSGEVKLTWDAAVPSGAGVTDYVIESSVDGTTWTRVDDGVSTDTSSTVGGLTNGDAYRFRVAAANQFGAGPFSGTVQATPVWMPAAPELTAGTAPIDGVGSGEVQLSWTVPADNGLAISDYVVEGSVDGDTWTALDDAVSTATAYTVGGLHDGTEYLFRVFAVNKLGQGQPSIATPATPTWTPAAPSRLSAAVAPADGLGSGQVGLTWTAPVDHGSAITKYVIEASTDGATWTVVDDGVGPTASATVNGLVDGASIWLRLAAVNAIGRSEWSVPIQTTPLGPPDVPGGLDAAAAAGQVGLTWTAPSATGGSMITDYVIEQSTDGTTWTTVNDGVSAATETTVDGLTNGTGYEFRVAAVNVVGAGPWSSPVHETPVGKPESPSALLATPGAGRARLTWTAPDSNGSPLTDYIVQRSTDGTTWTTIRDGVSTATATTVSGLSNGTRYQFRVAAANGVGAGPWSSPAQATPVAKPGRPSALRATAGVGRVRLTWTAAASNGSPITDYIVQRAIGRRWITVNDGVRIAPSATVTGLTNGTSYRFRVAAKNAVGQSAWSAAVRATPHAR